MRYFLLLASILFVGCTQNTSETEVPSPEANTAEIEITANIPSTEDVITQSVTTVGSGERCGGPENIICAEKLYCIKEVETQENFGTCQSMIVDQNNECSDEQSMVCGLWNNKKKIGYLNECEAERNGAEVINRGFCGRANNFEKPCEAPVLGIGVSCNKYFTGYQYKNGTCVEVPVQGCDIETPFESLEACQNTCV